MVDVKALLKYNDQVRAKYLEKLAAIPWQVLTEDKGASFGSIRNIFIHTLGATDYWLDFLQNEENRSRRKFDEYKTFDDIRTYVSRVEDRMSRYLSSLPDDVLNKQYSVTNDDGKSYEVSAEDVLIHVFEEEVHHRGELIALLWQMDVTPPSMGWKDL